MPNIPRLVSVKVPPRSSSGAHWPARGAFNQRGSFGRQLRHPFAAHIAYDRHQQAAIRVHRQPDVDALPDADRLPTSDAFNRGCSRRAACQHVQQQIVVRNLHPIGG